MTNVMKRKKQIRLTEADIKALVKEAIQDKLGGVFSTDDPKAADAVRNDRNDYDAWYGEDWESKKNREDLANLIDKRANGEIAELDPINNKKYMAGANMESEPEKEESERFDRPFGDLDDTENLWRGDPNLEEPEEDEDEIAGLNERRQIRLSESQLRDFVSYSVRKILSESLGRPMYDANGQYDGQDDYPYGSDSFVFEPDLEGYLRPDLDFGEMPKVRVYYTKTEGRKGDYMTPDDPDTIELDNWEIVSPDKSQLPKEVLSAVYKYMDDFDIEAEYENHPELNEGWDDSIRKRNDEWENEHPISHKNGVKVGGDKVPNPKNPYKDMTWDEYCVAKKKEHEDGKKDGDPKKSDEKNRGIMAHFD